MSFPFEEKVKINHFTQSGMIERIKQTFKNLPDSRKSSPNQKYKMSDAALSAFSVFFMQSPSFLDHQKSLQKQQERNNAQNLLGIYQIPSDNQIRNLLDTVSSDTLIPLYRTLFSGLEKKGKLQDFHVLNDNILIALDGVEYFSSQKIHCENCSTKTLKNEVVHYFHTAITPVVVSPNQSSVIPLSPEFVQPQDGCDKQDYELAASKRWINREHFYLPDKVTILGDDLYCHQPFCQQVIDKGWNFIFVCKPNSHKTLYEWVNDFERTGQIKEVTKHRWTGKQRLTERYRFIHQVPLRNTDDSLLVDWCELETTNEKGDIIYRNSYVTNDTLNENNVIDIFLAGRTRWKIENENNNTLKTKGYHFKHNFGHGKKHLSSLLASLIILAYLLHTLLEWFDACYQLLRKYLPSRKTFFDDVRSLTRYMIFDHWQSLMEFMLRGLDIPIPKTGFD